jgi:hypothetical protein
MGPFRRTPHRWIVPVPLLENTDLPVPMADSRGRLGWRTSDENQQAV